MSTDVDRQHAISHPVPMIQVMSDTRESNILQHDVLQHQKRRKQSLRHWTLCEKKLKVYKLPFVHLANVKQNDVTPQHAKITKC